MERKVCRICRRERQKLYLKGSKCYAEKCPFERRPYPPGQHGKMTRFTKTDYGIRLREKQKIKNMYFMDEKQFKRFFNMALRAKGNTGVTLLTLLERRLDNMVYRAGFASSRRMARQFVAHGHVKVNGNKVDIPSYLVDVGDKISVKTSTNERNKPAPAWLEVNEDAKEVVVLRLPDKSDIDYDVNESLIIEFYSR